MFEYPYEKYHYFSDGRTKVVALSTYAGKPIRGIAKCDPQDKFNAEVGRKLAAARCNYKIAVKRYENALRQYDYAEQDFIKADEHMMAMRDYLNNAQKNLVNADEVLSAIERELED